MLSGSGSRGARIPTAAPWSPRRPSTARSPGGASRSSAKGRVGGRPPSPTRQRGPRRRRLLRGRLRGTSGGHRWLGPGMGGGARGLEHSESGLSCQSPDRCEPLVAALNGHVVGCEGGPDTCRARHNSIWQRERWIDRGPRLDHQSAAHMQMLKGPAVVLMSDPYWRGWQTAEDSASCVRGRSRSWQTEGLPSGGFAGESPTEAPPATRSPPSAPAKSVPTGATKNR